MMSKEALYLLMANQKKVREGFKFINLNTHEKVSIGECYDIVIKDLEILEILKNKLVDITILYFSTCIEVYNCGFANRPKFQLTQEEYNKIKEWLKNDKKRVFRK